MKCLILNVIDQVKIFDDLNSENYVEKAKKTIDKYNPEENWETEKLNKLNKPAPIDTINDICSYEQLDKDNIVQFDKKKMAQIVATAIIADATGPRKNTNVSFEYAGGKLNFYYDNKKIGYSYIDATQKVCYIMGIYCQDDQDLLKLKEILIELKSFADHNGLEIVCKDPTRAAIIEKAKAKTK